MLGSALRVSAARYSRMGGATGVHPKGSGGLMMHSFNAVPRSPPGGGGSYPMDGLEWSGHPVNEIYGGFRSPPPGGRTVGEDGLVSGREDDLDQATRKPILSERSPPVR